jgi:hypothetical protein
MAGRKGPVLAIRAGECRPRPEMAESAPPNGERGALSGATRQEWGPGSAI